MEKFRKIRNFFLIFPLICLCAAFQFPFFHSVFRPAYIDLRVLIQIPRMKPSIMDARKVNFMKILVTGFDPFGGEKVNPAIESVKLLPDTIAGAEIIKLEIPTVVYKSLDRIDAKIAECDPDVIVSVGQAGGRPDITVERVGINVNDCRIPDNEGNQPIDEPVYADGPAAYFSALPIKAMVKHINDAGIPASVSDTAGTFICNHVLYGVRYLCEHKYPGKKSGFIHIPFMTSQAVGKRGVPSMSLSDIVKGLTAAIEAIVLNEEDIKVTGGHEH